MAASPLIAGGATPVLRRLQIRWLGALSTLRPPRNLRRLLVVMQAEIWWVAVLL